MTDQRGLAADLRAGLLDGRPGHRRLRPRRRHGRRQEEHHRRWAARSRSTRAEGYGMSVKVRLPLTLAIMDGMCDRRRRRVLHPAARPRWSSRSRSRPGMIKTIGGSGPRRRGARRVHARHRPRARLRSAALRLRARRATSWSSSRPKARRVALLVDELLGQQQVVVKNLEANYRKVQDVSGATIMGDGRVALILDIGSLVRRSRH